MAYSLENELVAPQLNELDKQSALVHWSRKERVNEIFRGFLKPIKESRGVRDIRVRLHGPVIDRNSLVRAAISGNRAPKSRLALWLKATFLKGQYNWAFQYLNEMDAEFLIVWNGIKGHRRVLAEAAKSQGRAVVFFEEAPIPGRVSADFQGVNYGNSLPRKQEFYRFWSEEAGADVEEWRRIGAVIKPRGSARRDVKQTSAQEDLAKQKYIFCPLQVPGDSQITIYGDWIKSVENFIDTLSEGSKALPDGWHLRIKEHPSAKVSFAKKLSELTSEKFQIDNETNTFEQVAASHAVATVNSSVGLQSFFFDKPVLVFGQAFYAFDGAATQVGSMDELKKYLETPEEMTFNVQTRNLLMTYLDQCYLPSEEAIKSGEYTISDLIKRDQERDRLYLQTKSPA